MGYLVDQMEKLAKETERSLGDKALLAGGTLAGVGASGAGAGLALPLTLGSDAGVRGLTNAAGISNANEVGLQKIRKGLADKLSRAKLFTQMLGSEAAAKGAQAAELSQAFGNGKGLSKLDGARAAAGHIWKAVPKKVKLLAALGLPVTAAAGYGGYKATDAMLGE